MGKVMIACFALCFLFCALLFVDLFAGRGIFLSDLIHGTIGNFLCYAIISSFALGEITGYIWAFAPMLLTKS